MKQKHFRSANVRANSYDEDAGTIEVIWTTGAAVRRSNWDGEEYDEVLSLEPGAVNLDRLNNGAPLLDAHQDGESANIVGAVVRGTARIEDGRGVATVLLSKASDVADIVTKIREGTAPNVSVGYWIDHTVRQDGTPPTVLVDRWTPLEISVAPIPADPNAQFRSASGRRTKRRSRAQAAAAEARRLLQPTQSAAQARGAAEARRLLRGRH
jgi:phage head maturation protease